MKATTIAQAPVPSQLHLESEKEQENHDFPFPALPIVYQNLLTLIGMRSKV